MPAEQIAMVCDMGFTAAQARKALGETGGSIERAIEWLFSHPDDDGSALAADTGATSSGTGQSLPGSEDLPAKYRLKAFISHKGPSVHSGHYVAHVWTGQANAGGVEGKGGWVLFNDEKVVRADEGEQAADKLMPLAYVYVFERVRE